ncbi:MAG: 16S rRNA (guanine(527)-N(7))-methyltransferase RsmG [Actinobacteria bacterium]|nr:16S rRNA (guanine(527)-N(7))-methyltransferase RsmG [Actinomycetota bacterium]
MDETVDERLGAYAELVRKWAPRVNLIAAGDLEHLEARHIEDSLRALPLVTEAPEGPGIDLGSGAGLPGVPLAIAEPGRHWRMLEPRAKRAAFLEEVARELGLTYEVIRLTAQEAAHDRAFARVHAVATARALAPPEEAASLLRPLLAPDGVGILFLGADAALPEGAEAAVPGLAIIGP